MNYLYILIISIIGYLIAYKINSRMLIPYLLLFSGAYLLSICISEIIFHSYENIGYQANYFILLGLLLQFIIDSFSKGIEHGHSHKNISVSKDNKFVILIALCLHSIFESLSINIVSQKALYAIMTHKFVISIILCTLVINSKLNTVKSITYISVFALSPLIGWACEEYIQYFDIDSYINAIIGGMFINISANIISEGSKQHKLSFKNIIIIIFGFLLAFF